MPTDEARHELERLLQAARAYVLRGPDPAGERQAAYRAVTSAGPELQAVCASLALDPKRVRSAFTRWRHDLLD
jgi:hypothetical protein